MYIRLHIETKKMGQRARETEREKETERHRGVQSANTRLLVAAESHVDLLVRWRIGVDAPETPLTRCALDAQALMPFSADIIYALNPTP